MKQKYSVENAVCLSISSFLSTLHKNGTRSIEQGTALNILSRAVGYELLASKEASLRQRALLIGISRKRLSGMYQSRLSLQTDFQEDGENMREDSNEVEEGKERERSWNLLIGYEAP